MAFDTQMVKLSMLAAINPARKIKKGTDVPFVDMAALPTHGRDIQPANVSHRVAKGAGAHFRNGDTLLARITPCLENGKTAQVRCLDDGSIAEGSTEFIVLAGNDPADNDYVYYLCRNPDFRDFAIKRMEGTSGRQRVSWNAIAEYEFACPEPETRRSVAEVLSSLDDRIDLLRQTNTTLEAIAQALFKSWFVDFDPVHAKAEGREPEAMDAATAALFPSEFEESELGPIPKGWVSSAVYDLAQFINGAAYKAFDPNRENRGLPIIKIAELKAGVTEQTAYSDMAMPDKYRIDTGEILFSWSGNPDTSIDTFVWSSGSAWLNQHIFRVVPNSSGRRSFVLLALKYLRPTFAEIARNKQTTGLGHVTVSDLKRLRIAKSDEAVLQRWSLLVDLLVERSFAVQQQAQTLAELRDTLLPRLISGKLRLPEATEAVEAALA